MSVFTLFKVIKYMSNAAYIFIIFLFLSYLINSPSNNRPCKFIKLSSILTPVYSISILFDIKYILLSFPIYNSRLSPSALSVTQNPSLI